MKILFFNMSPLVFDVSTPGREPLGGSESSVCYLARQMAKDGHDVTLMARLPEGTAERVMGVRHKPVSAIGDTHFFAAEKFDAVITSNAAIACPRLKELNPKALNIFWCHMLPDQPAMREAANPEVRPSIDCFVYLSPWQKAEMDKAFGPVRRDAVIGNGLTPAFESMFASPAELRAAKQNRAAYTSTPFRGLGLLLDTAVRLGPKTEFDIYSSMRVYQAQKDEHAALYQRAGTIPHVHYHDAVGQDALAANLRADAFLAYPCIFPETYCIAALEAMAAGMKIVTTRLGALETTTAGYADLLSIDPTAGQEKFVAAYTELLGKNIGEFKSAPGLWAERMFAQLRHVNQYCSWAMRAKEWQSLLEGRG